ncbi:MAG: hypothetical protein ONB44_13900 [candidate division KSB1 bacterium]|nr:hypothetical protein [candidate division KSB1 bacterium]MDZ7303217.1 hypothetical protein [candidate division KSB1 bacterium]MDZ7312171.1 hypothetical protein [candidate division KSB1 bacterium]
MRTILQQSNLDLLREIEQLKAAIHERFKDQDWSASAPDLLPYYKAIVSACNQMHQRVKRNLNHLNLGRDDILEDILSETQELSKQFHFYNRHLLSPLMRYRDSDRLCLRLLRWLHEHHPDTKSIPVGLSDGEFGIWPDPQIPIVYYMPTSAQFGLLYLPLFFHEFGHLLYACHKPELDDLVRDFQQEISALLGPIAERDDAYSKAERAKRTDIIRTWYVWMQELFCDSVGFGIGGPSFAHAFSMYLRMRGRREYQVPEDELTYRGHPVTWLRIRVLADQMRRANFQHEAETLEQAWEIAANTMGINEDYFGYFDKAFLPLIQKTIEDMLVETAPRNFTDDDISLQKPLSPQSSPIHLLNYAWATFLSEPTQYGEWQRQILVGIKW